MKVNGMLIFFRKRMSMIIKTQEGEIKLLCKGADSIIYELLAQDSLHKECTLKFLEGFGNEGLRTLAFAERTIPEEEYSAWEKRYTEASQAIYDREKQISSVKTSSPHICLDLLTN
jgi:magnesium-transporting ATPase (P-type)